MLYQHTFGDFLLTPGNPAAPIFYFSGTDLSSVGPVKYLGMGLGSGTSSGCHTSCSLATQSSGHLSPPQNVSHLSPPW